MLEFRKLQESDIPLLTHWLNQKHLRAFYQKVAISEEKVIEKYLPRIRGKVPTYCHLALLNHQAFGKIQCYRINDNPTYAKEIGVDEGISVDLFIGEANFLARGFGKQMLASYLKEIAFALFPEENKCYICHDLNNKVALATSYSSGFRFVREVVEDGTACALLCIDRSHLG